MMTASATPLTPEQSLAQAICAALAFEAFYHSDGQSEPGMGGCISNCVTEESKTNILANTITTGTIHSGEDGEDDNEIFYDTMEHSHELDEVDSESGSPLDIVKSLRGGTNGRIHPHSVLAFAARKPPPPPRAPPPPEELPLRFLRAGKGDPVVGQQRYESTLEWRKEHRMDYILSDPHPYFELIKKHYPHYFHLRGKKNEPVYFESPPKTDLKALREGGVDLQCLLRHYAMVTEYMWQYVEQDDFARSIYIIDLEGIRVTDFVGECVDFVRQASAFCNQHFPERAGYIMVINVPHWFKIIWNVVRKFADPVTLEKVHILRGKDEVLQKLREKIPIENIPPEYGGKSMPLGQAPEETMLRSLMKHNNDLQQNGIRSCGGARGGCKFCKFVPVRSY